MYNMHDKSQMSITHESALASCVPHISQESLKSSLHSLGASLEPVGIQPDRINHSCPTCVKLRPSLNHPSPIDPLSSIPAGVHKTTKNIRTPDSDLCLEIKQLLETTLCAKSHARKYTQHTCGVGHGHTHDGSCTFTHPDSHSDFLSFPLPPRTLPLNLQLSISHPNTHRRVDAYPFASL